MTIQRKRIRPELPEVETIKNELTPYVIGRRITSVNVLWDRSVRQPSVDEFKKQLTRRKITGLARRGKYLVFSLDDGNKLIVHLRMTGALLVKPKGCEPEKYVRVVFCLDDGSVIHFRDLRKFGKMWLVKDLDEVVQKLGPEPLKSDFTAATLAKIVADRQTPIKALLVDQALIAGIGNMYADEALYAARIHPLLPARSLTKEEIRRLHSAIKNVLQAAIGNKGASTSTYLRPDGQKGSAHYEFKVAHRLGGKCECGGEVGRIVVRQRGTYYCPRCQKLTGGEA
jgi:formamidopyrimidine-DNA glycosylase